MEDHEDALHAIRDQTRQLEQLRATEDEISAARTHEMVALRIAGISREVIADAAGLTPARVTQILGRAGYAKRPGVVRNPVKEPVRATRVVEPAPATAPRAQPHRHRFVATAWNHRRGGYLLRQACECGLTRVIPVPQLPKELGNRFADTSVVA